MLGAMLLGDMLKNAAATARRKYARTNNTF
jgi:hypothetical protein